jgi:hypothetical protein
MFENEGKVNGDSFYDWLVSNFQRSVQPMLYVLFWPLQGARMDFPHHPCTPPCIDPSN